MLVDEAQTKWCCTHEIEKCLADECMAWRWYYEAVPDDEFLFVMSKTNGYCGLAGKEGAE